MLTACIRTAPIHTDAEQPRGLKFTATEGFGAMTKGLSDKFLLITGHKAFAEHCLLCNKVPFVVY